MISFLLNEHRKTTTYEFQVLALDGHNNLLGKWDSNPPSLDNWISNYNTDINKPVQIPSTHKDNILSQIWITNIASTSVSMNVRS